ncbi:MAG: hypothetical protein AB2A00_33935 [Myxococcota bacterium]
MQCPGCKAFVPINFENPRCKRCGRLLPTGDGPAPEISSPTLEVATGVAMFSPSRMAAGIFDVVELTFAPRDGWERSLSQGGVFLGERSSVGIAAVVMSGVAALCTATGMATVGLSYGVEPYVTTRTWSTLWIFLLPPAWIALGYFGLKLGRKFVEKVLPRVDDKKEAKQNASRVAVLGGAPALFSSFAAVLWVLPDLGPLLSLGALAYALHASFQGIWRGSGVLGDLDAAARKKLLFTLAVPLTAAYSLLGGLGLILLIVRE